MILSLIGMSGSGKTYWAKKLEKSGFKRYSIDELIEAKLEKELTKIGYSGLSGVARWMGMPDDPQYPASCQEYLDLEGQCLESVLSSLEKIPTLDQNIIIDTTGSVIYLESAILKKLKRISRIIYLQIAPLAQKKMFELYLNDPKPVVWGDIFKPEKGESKKQALARCYPELLKYRATRYEQLADLTLDAAQLKSPTFSLEKFTNIINKL